MEGSPQRRFSLTGGGGGGGSIPLPLPGCIIVMFHLSPSHNSLYYSFMLICPSVDLDFVIAMGQEFMSVKKN